jgi:hypothetical protein
MNGVSDMSGSLTFSKRDGNHRHAFLTAILVATFIPALTVSPFRLGRPLDMTMGRT